MAESLLCLYPSSMPIKKLLCFRTIKPYRFWTVAQLVECFVYLLGMPFGRLFFIRVSVSFEIFEIQRELVPPIEFENIIKIIEIKTEKRADAVQAV